MKRLIAKQDKKVDLTVNDKLLKMPHIFKCKRK
jgi:hypothetical protein